MTQSIMEEVLPLEAPGLLYHHLADADVNTTSAKWQSGTGEQQQQQHSKRALNVRDVDLWPTKLHVDSSYSHLQNNWKQDKLNLPSGK